MYPDELQRKISQYRTRGVLVDSNLLLLYFIGEYDRTLITTCKRTRDYDQGDFDLLRALLGSFRIIYTTPNILTEVSNLSDSVQESARNAYYAEFCRKVAVLREEYVKSVAVTGDRHLWRLGLTDVVIARLAKGRCLVVTADLPLAVHLENVGIDVINFNHIRSWYD